MENQVLADKIAVNSEEFLQVSELKRYVNDKNDGRCVTFSVSEQNDYHMYFVSSGTLEIKNEASVYKLSRLDILIYQPKGRQILISPRKTNYVHCVFSGTNAKKILERLEFLNDIVYHIVPSFESGEAYLFFNKRIEYIISEYQKQKKYSDLSVACMFIEFLTLCARNIVEDANNQNIQYVKQAMEYIVANAHRELDVDELIKMSHLSKSRFYALFKKYTGTSPVRFHNSYRLTAAADYLIVYDLKINEVSKKLGFQDPLYFSRLFKKEFNVSPSAYIKQNKTYMPIQDEEREI